MYELVNTSLPNGLIAGTHGFATVAMTKGLPDVLRNRLETLCAYNHRTSSHDQSYWSQNPINWFHVVLPQGEHIAGCVAPSDFDYTGRTNRLAKLRIFSAAEMPIVGAAEILNIEKKWFQSSWQGEPCYLPENKAVCGVLRMQNPNVYSSASEWEALFGANGFRLAQQFAWLLEKNILGGGKPIYFKTSVVFDLSGERLLGLFRDLIRLLPVEFRARVAFSTYPAAMPNGFSCHLRGVYDSDKIFEINSSVAPWIDCENARVVHPEMLPTEGNAKPAQGSGEGVLSGGTKKAKDSLDNKRTSKSAPASIEGRRVYNGIPAPQKQGVDMFVVSMIACIAALLLGAGIFFYWMISDTKKQIVASIDSVVSEEEVKKETEDLNVGVNNLPQDKTTDVSPVEKKNSEQQKENREEIDAIKAAEKKAREDARRLKELEKEKQKKDADREATLKYAFLDAVKLLPKISMDEKSFGTNDGCRVYYYYQGVLTNTIAGMVKKSKNMPASLRWGDGLSKGENAFRKDGYGFVIWYNMKTKIAYWEFLENKKTKGCWFENESVVNLGKKFFGVDDKVKELWERLYKGEPVYVISWNQEGCLGSIEIKANAWSKEDAVEKLKSTLKTIGGCNKEIGRLQGKINKSNQLIENIKKEIEEIKSPYNELMEARKKAEDLDSKIKNEKDEKEKQKMVELFCEILKQGTVHIDEKFKGQPRAASLDELKKSCKRQKSVTDSKLQNPKQRQSDLEKIMNLDEGLKRIEETNKTNEEFRIANKVIRCMRFSIGVKNN